MNHLRRFRAGHAGSLITEEARSHYGYAPLCLTYGDVV